ncbi:MAG: M20 family metallopeptidase [Candidatus Hydrogenedentota bacterium]
MNQSIRDTIAQVTPAIQDLRHDLHRIPEARYAEHDTSARIARFLDAARIPHQAGYAGGTGIVAELVGGRPGPSVLLRADMDALEMQEETGVPYASERPGFMHACGHDGHMACLCGVVEVLARHREILHGTVRFVFQPAEEQGAGGERMVAEGVCDGVLAAFALHGWPGLPVGTVGIRPGCVMASADFFRVVITGVAGHGADPGACIDPVFVAAHVTTALQGIVSRELDPWAPGVVTVARIAAGTTSNIIPGEAVMEGTFRALTPEDRVHIRAAIERITSHVAQALRASAEVTFGEVGYPPLINDPALAAFAHETLAGEFGPAHVVAPEHAYMTAEDFAFYTQVVPGTFLLLGVDGPDEARHEALHTPGYDFNDDAISTGITALAALALATIERGKEDATHG